VYVVYVSSKRAYVTQKSEARPQPEKTGRPKRSDISESFKDKKVASSISSMAAGFSILLKKCRKITNVFLFRNLQIEYF